MSIEVATGDLLRAMTLLNVRDDERVRLSLPAGFGELTVWRGCWESAIWAVESDGDGPTATVQADELRDAADRPMISSVDGRDGGGLQVAGIDIEAAGELEAPPAPSSLLGGADIALPIAGANPYAPTLAEIDQGAARVWIPQPVMQRLRLRQIGRVRVFPDLGRWYLSGVTIDDTHLLRVSAPIKFC